MSELCQRVELLWRGAKQQLDSTATSIRSTGDDAVSSTSSLPPHPCKDAAPSKLKTFTSFKAKQSSLPARARIASLPSEPQKFQLNLDKDAGNRLCAAKPKSGGARQGKCPPPIPPRKSIPQILKEIKQIKREIDQLTVEVSECTTYVCHMK